MSLPRMQWRDFYVKKKATCSLRTVVCVLRDFQERRRS
jgi:hypothetical protein